MLLIAASLWAWCLARRGPSSPIAPLVAEIRSHTSSSQALPSSVLNHMDGIHEVKDLRATMRAVGRLEHSGSFYLRPGGLQGWRL